MADRSSIAVECQGELAEAWQRIKELESLVAESQKALAALQKSEARLRKESRRGRESEQRFDIAFDGSPIGMGLARPDGKWLKVNRSLCQMLGYSEQELLATDLQSLTHPDDLPTQLEGIRSMVAGECATLHMEKRYLHRQGHVVYAQLDASLVSDAADHATYLVSQIQDITGRKQTEEALRALSARNEAILDAIPDILMETDLRKVYTWANGPGLAFFGEGALGQAAADYFVGEQTTYQVVDPLFEGRQDLVRVQSWQRRADGESRLLDWHCRTLRDAHGNVTGALSIARDLTDLKRSEESLRAINLELEAFTYSVSHNLRTPLRAMDGFGQVLSEEYGDKLDTEGQRVVGIIRDSTREMGQLIDDLLAFSQLTRKNLVKDQLDMRALAREAVDRIRLTAPERAIQFRLGTLPPARGDRGLLREVFVNLLANAVKFTQGREPALIEIEGTAGNNESLYCVKDNGVGFDMRYVDKLFGVFERLHSDEAFPGTGIGLALVKRIVYRHNGRVWAESVLDQGATFWFALPA